MAFTYMDINMILKREKEARGVESEMETQKLIVRGCMAPKE